MYDGDNTYIKIISAPFRLYLDSWLNMRYVANDIEAIYRKYYFFQLNKH